VDFVQAYIEQIGWQPLLNYWRTFFALCFCCTNQRLEDVFWKHPIGTHGFLRPDLRSLQAFGCASGLRGAHTASIFLHPCAARSTVSRQNNRLFEYMHAWFQQISPSGLPITDASVAFARDYFWNNMHSSLPELSLLIF
jgi:hypothetical protein